MDTGVGADRGRWWRRVGLTATSTAATVLGTLAISSLSSADQLSATVTRAVALSRRPIAAKPGWTRYVRGQSTRLVYPKQVYIQNGSRSQVKNPAGLEHAGGGVTTIHSTGTGHPRLVLDLGLNTGGYMEVKITKTDGTNVDLGYSETRRYLTPSGDYSSSSPPAGLLESGPDYSRSDTITAPRPERWTSPGVRGAERWILIQLQGAGTVSIDYVRERVTHFIPTVAGYTGHFLSNDRLLNRAWYSAAYTETLDTWRKDNGTGNWVVVDGAKRDREVFTGDAGVDMPTNLDTFAQGAAHARNGLYVFACYQEPDGYVAAAVPIGYSCPSGRPGPPDYHPGDPNNTIGSSVRLPEYTAWYVINAATYYRYTGDAATVRAMLPSLRRAVAYLERKAPTGLLVTAPGELNWHPLDQTVGASSLTNELYAAALDSLAYLEQEVGGGAPGAAPLRRKAASVEHALVAQLWDPTVGAFYLNSGDPMHPHGQDGNVAGVALGVIDPRHGREGLAFVREHLWTRLGPKTTDVAGDQYMKQFISPYVTSIELRARMAEGDTDGALALIRRTYGYMANSDPGTTWEAMSISGGVVSGGQQSWAHGWSTGAVSALSNYVLGVRPIGPGYATWVVAPQLGDLRWAQGQVPTPHGALVSRWAVGKHGSWFKLTVVGPRSTTGSVVVPTLGRSRSIAMNGRVVWRHGRASEGVDAARVRGGVEFAGIGGRRTFAWT
jgi:hypothetical protein